jgi:HTH-type transcriptional regulator/antitoxin HigA
MLAVKEATELASQILEYMPLLCEINTPEEHGRALSLMEELIEDYDNNLLLINSLSVAIECYEDDAPEFKEFNEAIASLESVASILNVLIDQHKLTLDDLPEIGKKSMVSQVLNGKKI